MSLFVTALVFLGASIMGRNITNSYRWIMRWIMPVGKWSDSYGKTSLRNIDRQGWALIADAASDRNRQLAVRIAKEGELGLVLVGASGDGMNKTIEAVKSKTGQPVEVIPVDCHGSVAMSVAEAAIGARLQRLIVDQGGVLTLVVVHLDPLMLPFTPLQSVDMDGGLRWIKNHVGLTTLLARVCIPFLRADSFEGRKLPGVFSVIVPSLRSFPTPLLVLPGAVAAYKDALVRALHGERDARVGPDMFLAHLGYVEGDGAIVVNPEASHGLISPDAMVDGFLKELGSGRVTAMVSWWQAFWYWVYENVLPDALILGSAHALREAQLNVQGGQKREGIKKEE